MSWLLLNAQPFPGNINPGTPGATAVYTATRTLGPGSGSGGSTNVGNINILYVTNLFVSVSYVTNQTILVSQNVNIQYVTNQYISFSITTNSYITTNFVNTQFVTNFYANHSFITNLTVNNLTVQNFFAQNTYFTTNAFPGPTNTFDLSNSVQLVETATPIAITNLGSVSNNYVGQGLLIVSNSSASAITVTVTIPTITTVGAQTTNRMSVPAGGMGWVKFFAYGNVFTNYADDLMPGLLATQDYVNVSTNGFLRAPVANASLANSSITIQGSAVALGGTTLAAGSTPIFDLSSSSNLVYKYTTNALTAITATFGKAYTTNLSADIVFTTINAQDVAAYETCIITLTNSSGSDWKITLPNGIRGTPGSGTPPVFYCTNKLSCDVMIAHYGNQRTNAWKIDWAP
jgi:hypothetical protein